MQLKVIANGTAKDKVLLLHSLKLFDKTVCVTGYDAEDATTIEITHVGIAFGGSEAKGSKRIADVVILDDSI
jgi:magnesium-transporting ATPase (P-type)